MCNTDAVKAEIYQRFLKGYLKLVNADRVPIKQNRDYLNKELKKFREFGLRIADCGLGNWEIGKSGKWLNEGIRIKES
jgi:hypothetical protein